MIIWIKKALFTQPPIRHDFLISMLGLILLMIGCDSPLSSQSVTHLSTIQSQIKLTQNATKPNENWLDITLYDAQKRMILNPSINIFVNNTQIPLQDTGGFFASRAPYRMHDVPVAAQYVFQIELSNHQRYFLASVPALPILDPTKIEGEEMGRYDQDYVVKWRDLKGVNRLEIQKTIYEGRKEPGGHQYRVLASDELAIGSDGVYVLPQKDFQTTQSILSMVRFTFHARQIGQVNDQLLKGSSIVLETSFDKDLDFDEQTKINGV